jgi:hypothetical protein
MPKKIASRRKNMTSIERGTPIMGPAKSMKRGQKSPSPKVNTTPETAPMA